VCFSAVFLRSDVLRNLHSSRDTWIAPVIRARCDRMWHATRIRRKRVYVTNADGKKPLGRHSHT
jgi:hypothetical protein